MNCNNGNLDCDCNSHSNCIFRQLAKTKKKLQAKEKEGEKFKNRADELKNVLAKVNKKINRIIEIDGYGFDEALTDEFITLFLYYGDYRE